MKAPMPWYGGKSRVAHLVWERFGTDIGNYVEPFFGSGAVLLGRPYLPPTAIETANDCDGYVVNFYRALQDDPATVARYADHPVFESDLHARHLWLVQQKEILVSRLEASPSYYDAKIAGYWVWGMSVWIGGEFCSGKGPWGAVEDDEGIPCLTRQDEARIERNLVHLGDAGRGVKRRLVHLGNAGMGVSRQLVHLGNAGMGVSRRLVHLGNAGQVHHDICPQCGEGLCGLYAWMEALAQRLKRVRICCGDWSRICGPSPTSKLGMTAVFLDPPYSSDAVRDTVYSCDDMTVAHEVRTWCLKNGENPLLRIALCGYAGEGHEVLGEGGWEVVAWKAAGGYGSQGNGRGRENSAKEQIWFSPVCLKPQAKKQLSFFERDER